MEILMYNKYESYALEIIWKINEKVRNLHTKYNCFANSEIHYKYTISEND